MKGTSKWGRTGGGLDQAGAQMGGVPPNPGTTAATPLTKLPRAGVEETLSEGTEMLRGLLA